MKNYKKSLSTSVAIAVLATTAISPAVNAEVSASAAVANMYLWRGIDLGDGSGAISGDITASSESGFYLGAWGSSGDDTLGNEYDLYAGWGGDLGSFSVDVSYWTYIYPEADIDANDLADIIISLGTGPVSFTLYEAVEGDDAEDYRYLTLGYEVGDWNFMVGHHDFEHSDSGTHLQIGYSYNENLSFAVSKFADDENGAYDDDVQFLVSYSLDIK